MSGFEWFLLVIVVVVVPLIVAVAVTLWTLEQARQRKRQNRPGSDSGAGPVKRRATRDAPAAGAADTLDSTPVQNTIGAEMTEVAMKDSAIASTAGNEVVTMDGPIGDPTESPLFDDTVITPLSAPAGESTPDPDGDKR